MTQEQLKESLKTYLETEFWPKHRGVDEPILLVLQQSDGAWDEFGSFEYGGTTEMERKGFLTAAMRHAVTSKRPYAASVVAEMRTLDPDDPDAHFDHVMATLERRDELGASPTMMLWKLGLDDAGLTFVGEGTKPEFMNFGGLYKDDPDVVKHWVYAKTQDGQLRLISQGGSFRSKPTRIRAIKEHVYYHLCNRFRCELNKKKVMKSLVVSYSPLEIGVGQTDGGQASK